MAELKRTIDFKLPAGALGASQSTDGHMLAVACMDGVYLADLKDRSFECIDRHDSYVSSVAFIGDSSVIVSGGYDGTLHWNDSRKRKPARSMKLHDFWSWDMAVSPNGRMIGSVTGQYLAGGYKYEPLSEREPSVCVANSDTGEILHRFSHVPPVQAVAFSPDSRYIAAGNMMGEVRIWDTQSGEPMAAFTTQDFTSWGVIKSHCYLGGIFSIQFTPDSQHVLLAGMGPMRDPMAGNGRQLWQKWSWQSGQPDKVDETHKNDSGEGLMETLAVHPDGQRFIMAGRLRGGDWNAALFDLNSGQRQSTLKTGYRITEALFSADGTQLILVGTQGQPQKQKDNTFPHFGRIEVYDMA